MDDAQLAALRRIFAGLNIFAPGGFSLGGQVYQAPPAANVQPGYGAGYGAAQGMPLASPTPPPLVALLAQALYVQAYAHPFGAAQHATPALAEHAVPPHGAPRDGFTAPGLPAAGDLLPALSAANAGRARWDSGWRIVQAMPGQITAQKQGALRAVAPGEFIGEDGPGAPPRPGASITLYAPRESSTLQPGFYFAFGEAPADPTDQADLVRYYFNVSATTASTVVQALTATLNRWRTPFRLKCLSHASLYPRLDSAVLYVAQRHWRIAADLLAELYQGEAGLGAHLDAETPLFARRLARGLAFAEDPGSGESFGGFCCRLLAEAVWQAYLAGEQGVSARLAAAEKQFSAYGMDWQRPYLRPGSKGEYEFNSF